jgi:hypothetical protein
LTEIPALDSSQQPPVRSVISSEILFVAVPKPEGTWSSPIVGSMRMLESTLGFALQLNSIPTVLAKLMPLF